MDTLRQDQVKELELKSKQDIKTGRSIIHLPWLRNVKGALRMNNQ